MGIDELKQYLIDAEKIIRVFGLNVGGEWFAISSCIETISDKWCAGENKYAQLRLLYEEGISNAETIEDVKALKKIICVIEKMYIDGVIN